MEVQTEPTLSISQRAYIISKDLRYLVDSLRTLLFVNLFFLALGWINTIHHFDETLYLFVYLELSFFTVYFLVRFLLKSPYKKIEQWSEDYLEDAYTVVFNTTIPKGDSSAERILILASAIFPQLRDDYQDLISNPIHKFKLYIKRKIIRSKKQYGVSKIFNYKVNSDSVDLAVKTEEGYFIVKDFKDKAVSVGELKDLIRILTRKFRVVTEIPPRIDIFRVICVAKTYDDPFINRETLEKLMTQELKVNFKIDLIIEEKVGYSVLWIS
jgi:hypothetical protein